MEIDEPEPDEPPSVSAFSDIDCEEEHKAAKARIVDDEDVEEHLSEVVGSYEHLETLASNLGAVVGIWSRIHELEADYGLSLGAHYFYDWEEEEYFLAYPLEPSQTGYIRVRLGAKILLMEVGLFSSDWYLCHAFLHLKECYESKGEEKLRQSFHFGKSLAEGNWKERAEEGFDAASREIARKKNAGLGSGDSSSQRKSANIEAVLEELETMSHLVGEVSEKRILAQAFENAAAKKPSFPKHKKTHDSYETELTSEEPYKSRYRAVFARSA